MDEWTNGRTTAESRCAGGAVKGGSNFVDGEAFIEKFIDCALSVFATLEPRDDRTTC